MIGATMDYGVELVARAFYEADSEACRWGSEAAVCKEQFRECARNAINPLNKDIGVLLLALKNSSAEACVRGTGLAA